jgi:hypothetical protein
MSVICRQFTFRWFTWVIAAMGIPGCAVPAAAGLSITEIWPGGLDGDEATSDWIEVTNLGANPIADLSDFHYRDNPVPDTVPDGLALSGGQLSGVGALAAGESAVFLVAWTNPVATESGVILEPTLAQAQDAFRSMWGLAPGQIKLGHMLDADGEGGPGLSGSGDRVILYDGQVTGSPVVDDQSFPVSAPASYIYDPASGQFGALAQAGVLGAYEGARAAGNGPGLPPPVGSPGIVPEPMSGYALALLACGLLRRTRAAGPIYSFTPLR